MPSPSPSRPRLDPLPPEDLPEEVVPLMEALGPLNIFTTLARHPKLMKRWMVFGSHVLMKNSLPPRDREILILRTGWRCGSDYEFGQHTIMGAQAGLTDDEVRWLASEGVHEWSAADAVLVDAADELVADHMISDVTWAALAADRDDHQLMDIVFTVGQYVLTSMALRSFGVQRDEGVPGFPT